MCRASGASHGYPNSLNGWGLQRAAIKASWLEPVELKLASLGTVLSHAVYIVGVDYSFDQIARIFITTMHTLGGSSQMLLVCVEIMVQVPGSIKN